MQQITTQNVDFSCLNANDLAIPSAFHSPVFIFSYPLTFHHLLSLSIQELPEKLNEDNGYTT